MISGLSTRDFHEPLRHNLRRHVLTASQKRDTAEQEQDAKPTPLLIGFRAVYVFERSQPDRRRGLAGIRAQHHRRTRRAPRPVDRFPRTAEHLARIQREDCPGPWSQLRRKDPNAARPVAGRGIRQLGSRHNELLHKAERRTMTCTGGVVV
jgi:hypothetical protein